ncbi:Hypothetical predicted protein [Podarcis lilfordi]|uniref:Uncharacterized protein n=1 Tax=Podarcis lilfordi TaxID=74358 RepID=A0AA35LM51_9SAUR|nr:Hypothetical predicted protein [Podarcis lilfordi]
MASFASNPPQRPLVPLDPGGRPPSICFAPPALATPEGWARAQRSRERKLGLVRGRGCFNGYRQLQGCVQEEPKWEETP